MTYEIKNTWRRKLAWWIDPQSELTFNAHWKLIGEMQSDRQWLSEFEIISLELQRLLINDACYLGMRAERNPLIDSEIGKFREMLRKKVKTMQNAGEIDGGVGVKNFDPRNAALPRPKNWLLRLPVIRHIRAKIARHEMDKHYDRLSSFGYLPVYRTYDLRCIDAIRCGKI